MRTPRLDDRVVLQHDLPMLDLRMGQTGTILSMWCAPQDVYEVEFEHAVTGEHIRALLERDQVSFASEQLVYPTQAAGENLSFIS